MQTAAEVEIHDVVLPLGARQSGILDEPTKGTAPAAVPKFVPKTEMRAPPVVGPLKLTEVQVTTGASKVNANFWVPTNALIVAEIATLAEPEVAVHVNDVLDTHNGAEQAAPPNEAASAADEVEPKFMPNTVSAPPPVDGELPWPKVTIGES